MKTILKSFFKELIKKAFEIKSICKKNPNPYNNGLLFGYYIILDTFRDEAINLVLMLKNSALTLILRKS